jgi:hypothetical protein
MNPEDDDTYFINYMMAADIDLYLEEEAAGLHGGDDKPLTKEERAFVEAT